MKFLITFFVLLQSTAALAALGDRLNLLDSDQRLADYSIHEIKASTCLVREYVSKEGLVFAVTWRGIKHPNFSNLFGGHYSEYKENFSKLSKKHHRHAVKIATSKAVIVHAGHMGDIHGIAYEKALVPSNVKVEDLK